MTICLSITPVDMKKIDETYYLELDKLFVMLKGICISVKNGASLGKAFMNYDSLFFISLLETYKVIGKRLCNCIFRFKKLGHRKYRCFRYKI